MCLQTVTVEERLRQFWLEYGLDEANTVYSDRNLFKIGTFRLSFPNLSKQGYMLHDVNHLLSGYELDWISEFELAAWELGSGARSGFGLSNLYPLFGTITGLILAPIRTVRAFKKGLWRVNAHRLSESFDVLVMDYHELLERSFRAAKREA